MASTQNVAPRNGAAADPGAEAHLGGEAGPAAPGSGARAPVEPKVPPPPESLEDTGLSEELVAGLVLKALYVRGAVLGFDLAAMLALPMALLDELIRQLQERRFVEVHETRGPSRGEYVFKLTSSGRSRAVEELEVSRYVGPAPVPFEDFCAWVERQAMETVSVSEPRLRDALDGIVLPDPIFDLLGPAINSGRSLFLHGRPGNGKTLLSEGIARLFGDRYFVPYAVLVDGAVMIVHDPVHHRGALPGEDETAGGGEFPGPGDSGPEAGEAVHAPTGPAEAGADTLDADTLDAGALDADTLDADTLDAGLGEERSARVSDEVRRELFRDLPDHDLRFAEARRPVVVTGGELTLDQLDLQWDPSGRMYQAPPQLKAAGGVLVVDDLGRQRVPVRDLLNRWVVPLEQRRDYLTLRSGRKIVVPFDSFVIFSTNLEPRELADEAFLRRIHYKIAVPGPDRDEYARIFRACCAERGIRFEEDALDFLYETFYGGDAIEPRRCHPRDVLDHLEDLAGYRAQPVRLTRELLEPACRSYFLPAD